MDWTKLNRIFSLILHVSSKDSTKEVVVDILQSSYFYDRLCDIEKLIDKGLIIVDNGKLVMHDLIQQMGFEIVQQESERSKKLKKLLCYEDAPEVLIGDMVQVVLIYRFPFLTMLI